MDGGDFLRFIFGLLVHEGYAGHVVVWFSLRVVGIIDVLQAVDTDYNFWFDSVCGLDEGFKFV